MEEKLYPRGIVDDESRGVFTMPVLDDNEDNQGRDSTITEMEMVVDNESEIVRRFRGRRPHRYITKRILKRPHEALSDDDDDDDDNSDDPFSYKKHKTEQSNPKGKPLLTQLKNEGLIKLADSLATIFEKVHTQMSKFIFTNTAILKINESDLAFPTIPHEVVTIIFDMAIRACHNERTYHIPMPMKNMNFDRRLTGFHNLKNMALVCRVWQQLIDVNYIADLFGILVSLVGIEQHKNTLFEKSVMKPFFFHTNPFRIESGRTEPNNRLVEGLFWWLIENPLTTKEKYHKRAQFIFRFVAAIIFSYSTSKESLFYRQESIYPCNTRVCLKKDIAGDRVPYCAMLNDSAQVRLWLAQGLVCDQWFANKPSDYDRNDYNIIYRRDGFVRKHKISNELFLQQVSQVLFMCHIIKSSTLDALTLL